MIRVGIVGTNTSHAGVYAGLLNGDHEGSPGLGAHATAAWSSGKEGLSGFHSDASELASKFGIEHVVNDPSDMLGIIDLALILDDDHGGALHADLARPFLEAGVATYIDKPMALEVDDAIALFDLATKAQTPLMSCSALRFADELATVTSPDLGDLSAVISVGPGDWYNYGIHAVEAAIAVYGVGAKSVLQVHSSDRDLTVISHTDGPRMVIGTLRDSHAPFHVTAYGADGVAETDVSNYSGFYSNTIRAAVRMAETRSAQVPREVTVEVLAILAAGQRSAQTGAAVQLDEVASGIAR
jgi:virulence factor